MKHVDHNITDYAKRLITKIGEDGPMKFSEIQREYRLGFTDTAKTISRAIEIGGVVQGIGADNFVCYKASESKE